MRALPRLLKGVASAARESALFVMDLPLPVTLVIADFRLASAFLKWILFKVPAGERLLARYTAPHFSGVLCGDASNMTLEAGLAKCRALNLEVPDGMYAVPHGRLAEVWNGMGPDAWSSGLRRMIDRLGSAVVPCSLPHDAWYGLFCDGTFSTWSLTMSQWERNSEKCVSAANSVPGTGWWTRRFNEFAAASVISALKAGAYEAWLVCYRRQRAERCRKRVAEYFEAASRV